MFLCFLCQKPMKFIDFLGLKSPPIDHGPRGDVHLPPLTEDSSSCVTYLRDEEKNQDEESREISSAQVVMTREFSPLTPDLKGFLGVKQLGNLRQETSPCQLKRKSMASLTHAETLVVEKKAKYNRTQKEKKVASGYDAEEENHNCVSTELTLLYDPYKIKKKLTQSDLGHLSRLLIGRDFVWSHVLPWMSEDTVRQVESGKGADVIVRDMDTGSEHRLMFVFWASSGAYVLKGGWIKEFVKRRGLVAGDEVGLCSDPFANRFYFSLLVKAN